MASAKVINALANTFKLAHLSLLILKIYEGLVVSEDPGIGEINQIAHLSKDIGGTGDVK